MHQQLGGGAPCAAAAAALTSPCRCAACRRAFPVAQEARGLKLDVELTGEDLREVVKRFKAVYEREGKELPQVGTVQLQCSPRNAWATSQPASRPVQGGLARWSAMLCKAEGSACHCGAVATGGGPQGAAGAPPPPPRPASPSLPPLPSPLPHILPSLPSLAVLVYCWCTAGPV